jgi:hypothetical protein
MPVVMTDEKTVLDVANGAVQGNNNPTSYLPAFSIGGQFDDVAKEWIDSFPSEYPYDRKRYDKGRSIYHSVDMSSTSNSWKEWGYTSDTATTGTDGWIFWSSKSTTTTTTSKNTVHIDAKSFGSGITVSIWRIGLFPVIKGQWCMYDPVPLVPDTSWVGL